jgi:hypothetical protein
VTPPRRLRAVAAVAVVLAALTACGTDPPVDDTAQLTDAEKQVRTDYLAYWDALLRANAVSDPEFADLLAHAGGEQLAAARAGIAQSKKGGIVAKGTVDHDVREVRLEGDLAYVVDCVDLRNWLQYSISTGAVVPDQYVDRPKQLGQFTLAPRDGAWLVTQTREAGSC